MTRPVSQTSTHPSARMAKNGRPTIYTPELAEKICELMATGTSVLQIGRMPDMPSERAIVNWRRNREDFCAMYDDAKDRMADHFAAEIIEIADTDLDPQRARNRIAARQWYAAKCAPRKYGDKIELGGTVQVARVFSDEDRAQAMLLILRKAKENAATKMLEIFDEAAE